MEAIDLKIWRIRRGWTQEQAADALGYSRRGYQDAEARDGPIELKMALAVAGHDLGCLAPIKPVHAFIGDDRSTCYLEFDRIPASGAERVLGLAAWAEKWGRAMTNAYRNIKYPRVPR